MNEPQKLQHNIRLPALDGLRGLAIIIVLCYHYFPDSLLCNAGWIGVDLFFVLSGFLITGRVFSSVIEDKRNIKKFFLNRFLRIVPLYYAVLIVFFLCWFFLPHAASTASRSFYTIHWWQYFFFVPNWVFINNIESADPYLLHCWSVSVEEQIYLVFPLLVLWAKSAKRIFQIALVILLTVPLARLFYCLLILQHHAYDIICWNTFFRADAFFAGVAVSLLYQQQVIITNYKKYLKIAAALSFGLLLTNIIITKNAEKYNLFTATIGYSCIAIMFAYLLDTSLQKKNVWLNNFLMNPVLRYAGKISYGIYLFHWPVFLTCFGIIRKVFSYADIKVSATIVLRANGALSLLLTLVVSHLSFIYFESYFLRRKKKYQ